MTSPSMTPLVERLRGQSAYLVEMGANLGGDVLPLWVQAADEIERLTRCLSEAVAERDKLDERKCYWAGLYQAQGLDNINMQHQRDKATAYARELLAKITEHNADCESVCKASGADRGCDAYTGRGLRCPDCPRDWLIELPAALASAPKGE